MSLISRKMLTPDEVLRIESPTILVMIAGEYSAILYVPDISQMHFNNLNGMGTKEHNRKLRVIRKENRPIRKLQQIKIWNIWEQIKQEELEENDEIEILRENWNKREKGEE